MADVLSQSEVDALLSAVDEGDIDTIISDEEESSEVGSIATYDFARPERVTKDQMSSLEAMHENFARSFSATLSTYLRTIIEVKLASVEQLTYSEFIMSLPNPTCFNLMSCHPLKGNMVLELNTSIVFPIIDKILGGGIPDTSTPDRPLTEIELRLVSKVINYSMEQLKEVWGVRYPVEFAVTETESNPQLMQIVAPNEVVVLICFEIKMGEASGMMNLCIPFMVIEPIMAEFSSQNWFAFDRKERTEQHVNSLVKGLGLSPLEVVIFLAETQLSVREFLDLKAGDIIMTEKLIQTPLLMKVAGKPKFLGTPGIHRNHKAFQVTEVADVEQGINR